MEGTELMFTDGTIDFVLNALGFKTNKDGYVVDTNGNLQKDLWGNKFKKKKVIAIHKDYWMTSIFQIKELDELTQGGSGV